MLHKNKAKNQIGDNDRYDQNPGTKPESQKRANAGDRRTGGGGQIAQQDKMNGVDQAFSRIQSLQLAVAFLRKSRHAQNESQIPHALRCREKMHSFAFKIKLCPRLIIVT